MSTLDFEEMKTFLVCKFLTDWNTETFNLYKISVLGYKDSKEDAFSIWQICHRT